MNKISNRLKYLYPTQHEEVYKRIVKLIDKWRDKINLNHPWVSNKDIMLITYGDSIYGDDKRPLQILKEFADQELKGYINNIHLLPIYPYTSDDGFSVTNFREVNEEIGTWEDVEELKEEYGLMLDAVINHVSKSSSYFRKFLLDEPEYKDFFIEADPTKDYSKVIRPRALPLLTEFNSINGIKHVWTTFSEDQVDLNYKDPNVLLEILDVLLLYVSKGARFIRLDAIGFAWKEDNTTCMHLPQTHELIKLMRDVIDNCSNGCNIITETNVPHKENISYFGNGYDEAALVYQFPLPPLTLHSYVSGKAIELTKWAKNLDHTSEKTTYFNFLASHDGIGVRPVEGILSQEQLSSILNAVTERGGQISYRTLPDGGQSPYELNINYLDAIAGDVKDIDEMVQKYMSSQCILLSIVGVPGIYYHSLIGSRNSYSDYEESGIKRRINREKLNIEKLREELSDQNSLRYKVLSAYKQLISIRKEEEAFSPNSHQQVLELDERLFAIIRGDKESKVLVIINVSDEIVNVKIDYKGIELLTGRKIENEIQVKPYEYMWIKEI